MKKPRLPTCHPSLTWPLGPVLGRGGGQAQAHCTALRNPVHPAVCAGVQSPESASAGGQSQEVLGVFREANPDRLLLALGLVHSLWLQSLPGSAQGSSSRLHWIGRWVAWPGSPAPESSAPAWA